MILEEFLFLYFGSLLQELGMSIYDAFKCFLYANELIWNTNTNFVDGACGVLQACEQNGFDCDKVKPTHPHAIMNYANLYHKIYIYWRISLPGFSLKYLLSMLKIEDFLGGGEERRVPKFQNKFDLTVTRWNQCIHISLWIMQIYSKHCFQAFL